MVGNDFEGLHELIDEAQEILLNLIRHNEHVNQFISNELASIAEKLPTLAHSDPASFACGYNTGYKQALLALDRMLNIQD